MIEHLAAIARYFEFRLPQATGARMGHTLEFDLDDWRCRCGARLKRFQTHYDGDDKPFVSTSSHTVFDRGRAALMQFVCLKEHITTLNLGAGDMH